MRFKLAARFLLISGLCICLTCEELWLKNAPASDTGRVVFSSFRDGNPEIYVMDADGRNQKNLSNHPAYDSHPDWSPDGTKIAFVSSRDGDGTQIYVMDADGKNVVRLTEGWERQGDPDWSPDGGKIAFTVYEWDVHEWETHIAVMDADGGNREKLEDQASGPSWSPDGKQIAFVSRRDGDPGIFVIGAHGRGPKRVKRGLGGFNPSFSPDGRRIAFFTSHKGFRHIYVVGIDGRNLNRLSHNEEHHWGPKWSPDGQTIAYWVWDGILEGKLHGTIHLMTADGKYLRQLSDSRNARDYLPDIGPLGLAVSPTSNKTTIWGKLKKVEFNRP